MEKNLKTTKKIVKKSFFNVKAPLTSAVISLYGHEASEFDGRVVKLDLTRILKGKSFELKLRINYVNNELEGTPIRLELMKSYILRAMRRGIDYVEDSFDGECKDAKIRIKPFLIARNKVSRAVRKALRETAKKNILSYVKSRTAKEIFTEIMTNKLQKELSLKLRKIYPLALCEIRIFEIEEIIGNVKV